ncbi:hypothetical protein LEP1GSC047_2912 [Leptospira inadai serovar Lyme str. 10]|uniref:Uncharacterized protein n=1 Tax=Leptospira inadai serovar Lyme str. 10 TaxID=1049790 RepID=V6HB07_9LEPT|nr:hypothetical protein LEP1GSC047_2912 [Leptospira inadai serovar Lyme str. 10]
MISAFLFTDKNRHLDRFKSVFTNLKRKLLDNSRSILIIDSTFAEFS